MGGHNNLAYSIQCISDLNISAKRDVVQQQWPMAAQLYWGSGVYVVPVLWITHRRSLERSSPTVQPFQQNTGL